MVGATLRVVKWPFHFIWRLFMGNEVVIRNGLPAEFAGSIEVVNLDTLVMDPKYQRGVKAHAKKIEKDFLAEACSPLVVGRRRDGTEVELDGKQRCAALKARGIKTWLAQVIPVRDEAHEAEIFQELNNPATRKPLTWHEFFNACVHKRDDAAMALLRLLAKHGLEYRHGGGGRWNQVGSTGLLYKCIKADGEGTVDRALGIIVRAWAETEGAFSFSMLSGLLRLLSWQPDRVDDDRLVMVMAKAGPKGVSHKAGAGVSHNKGTAICRALVQLYNVRLADRNRLSETGPEETARRKEEKAALNAKAKKAG